MKEYLDLVRTVLEKGIRKPSRTGVDTIAYFGAFYKVDLANGFPLLTTKKVNYNACLHELLWYLSGEDHIRNLKKVTKIWDAWADPEGNLETAYGRYWRRFPHPVQKSHAKISETGETTAPVEEIDQIQYVVDEIKKNPFSRRLVVTAWEPGNAERSKLPPCHYTFAFNVSPDETGKPSRLNCHLTQRSGDIALGIPFNLACYATLTQILAQEVGLQVGQFAHTIIDAHIYCADPGSPMAAYDHVAGLKEQLKREPRPLPRLVIANKPMKDLKFEDFRVEGYDPHPPLQFKVAVQFAEMLREESPRMLISIIVAMTPDRLIGAAGRLPWYLPEDLKRFKARTTGHAIIMGRKTFSSIGRALPKRRNLVVSRNSNPPATEGVEWFKSLDEAIDFARSTGETECFIAGGTEIYAEGLAKANRMYITYVQRDFPFQGDTYFPMWDQAQWHAVSHELVKDLEFVTYERVEPTPDATTPALMEPGN